PLLMLAALWLIAAAVRLARFNVRAAAGGDAHYRGIPSTMAAGILFTAFLTAEKYSGSQQPGQVLPLHTEAVLDWLPLLLLGGALSMLSPLKVPRLGRTRQPLVDGVLLTLVVSGIFLGAIRRMPEFLLACAMVWLLVSLTYHLRHE